MKTAALKSSKENESRAAANFITQRKNDQKNALGAAANIPAPVGESRASVPNRPKRSSAAAQLHPKTSRPPSTSPIQLKNVTVDMEDKQASENYDGESNNTATTKSNMEALEIGRDGDTNFKEIFDSFVTVNTNHPWTKFNCAEPNALSKMVADSTPTTILPKLKQTVMDRAKTPEGEEVRGWDAKSGVRKRCDWCASWLTGSRWAKSHVHPTLIKDVRTALKSHNVDTKGE